MGYPLVDIAFGRDNDAEETFGHAKGVIAFGDVARDCFRSEVTAAASFSRTENMHLV